MGLRSDDGCMEAWMDSSMMDKWMNVWIKGYIMDSSCIDGQIGE